jgi:DNA (cytosine-5)-methyltransferase 1
MISLHEYLKQGKRKKPDDVVPSRMRRITIKEAARIQTFPDDYIWEGGKSSIYKQIGNAVPVLLARSVSTALLLTLKELGIESKSHLKSIENTETVQA